MEQDDLSQPHDVQHVLPTRSVTSAVQVPASLLATVMKRIAEQEAVHQRLNTTPLPRLVQFLSHPQWEMRVAAITALAASGELASIDPLLIALHDEHQLVRVAAVRALGQLGEAIPLEQLIIALHDQTWQVREMVVLVLGDLLVSQEQAVKPLLKAALQDSHSTVRDAARAALERHKTLQQPASASKPVLATMLHPFIGILNVRHFLAHTWLVLLQQLALFQRRWHIPALLLFLSYLLILCTTLWLDSSPHHQGSIVILALMCTLSSGLGIAFTTDARHDEGFEIALSTPTSSRVVMFCRFLVVIALNMLLATCASLLLALLYQQGLWDIIYLWLGPLLLVSSLLLALTLLIGSWLSCLAIGLFSILQTQYLGTSNQLFLLHISAPWQLCLVLFCLAFAFLYAPRQCRSAD